LIVRPDEGDVVFRGQPRDHARWRADFHPQRGFNAERGQRGLSVGQMLAGLRSNPSVIGFDHLRGLLRRFSVLPLREVKFRRDAKQVELTVFAPQQTRRRAKGGCRLIRSVCRK
jgi:hypothetical protein